MAATTSDTLKHIDAQEFFNLLQNDETHEDYLKPPPTDAAPFATSVTPLPFAKREMSAEMLREVAEAARRTAPSENSDECYTDGSVDPNTVVPRHTRLIRSQIVLLSQDTSKFPPLEITENQLILSQSP